MGRLRGKGTDADNSKDKKSREQRMAEMLEAWQHDPDMCMIWAAFCTSSTLTLADGVCLAKTRRSSSEVLELLAGSGDADWPPAASHAQENEDGLGAGVGGTQGDQLWQTPPRKDKGQGDHPRGHAEGSGTPAKMAAEQLAEPAAASSAAPFACKAAEALGTGGSARFAAVAAGVGATAHAALPAAAAATRAAHAAAGPNGGAPPARARLPVTNPRDTNLAYFRRCVDVDFKPWVPGDFTAVSRLAKSVHGEVRHLQAKDGAGAVAKVVPTAAMAQGRERAGNEWHAWFGNSDTPSIEDLWNEIAVLAHLQRSFEQCRFIVRLQGIFQDLTSTYLVTEYCDGGELFERVAYGDPLSEGEKKRYVCQLLQAVQHLHQHNVGHRDISLENVLLRRGECVLMDFGQAVRLHTMDGTVLRYCAEAGKRMYRAPEMYVPRERPIQVVCPVDGAPGAIVQVSYDGCRCEVALPPDASPGKPCLAEPHGYAVASADVFACGVSAFVLLVGKPPWAVARDVDPTFSFIRRHGVLMLLQQWRGGRRERPGGPPADEESMLVQMLRVDPAKRPSVDQCLCSPWLESVAPPRTRTQSA